MKTFNHTAIKILAAALLLLTGIPTFAQTADVRVLAGRKGIWVICGDKLPKDFTYSIFRKKNKDPWAKAADVNFPASKDEILANLLNNSRLSGDKIASLSSERLAAIWQRITDAVTVNSPPEMQDNFALRQATGTAWYDGTADSAVFYQYKVQMTGKKTTPGAEALSRIVAWPGAKFNTVLKPLSIKPSMGGVRCEFEIADKGIMTHCKIFRSYYLRGGYEEIDAQPMYNTQKDKLILTFTDNTAVAKVPYTYIVLPLDAAGNPGDFSPELRAFDVAEKTIAPSVTNFKTQSVETEKSVKLSWTLKNKKDIIAVSIYKSATYDGKYVKIASVRPMDTTYLDRFVRPIETYYYSIVLNGTYENSPNSPRVSGILRASNKNLFPPQNVRAIKKGNVVNLFWDKSQSDSRAYYIYRATGLKEEFRQIGPLIITDKTKLFFKDTLPLTNTPIYYQYAVASENTSYAISPKSSTVIVYADANISMPIPYDVSVKKVDDNSVRVIWPDMERSSGISGYMVYRRAKSTSDTTKTEALKPILNKPLPLKVNQFVDNTLAEGMTYYYSVRTIGVDTTLRSSPSLEAGYTTYLDLPSEVSNVRAFVSGKTVQLKWDNPMGQNIQSVKILRAMQGSPVQELVTLGAGKDSYTDKDVTAGKVYYYSLVIQNSKGENSKNTPPVGIHTQ